jgi:hypothetical protein
VSAKGILNRLTFFGHKLTFLFSERLEESMFFFQTFDPQQRLPSIGYNRCSDFSVCMCESRIFFHQPVRAWSLNLPLQNISPENCQRIVLPGSHESVSMLKCSTIFVIYVFDVFMESDTWVPPMSRRSIFHTYISM